MSNNFSYLFEIILSNGNRIFLNSSPFDIIYQDHTYMNYSGLNIKEVEFNDSAQNYVNIEGIYEENGIWYNIDLNESEFLIYRYDHATNQRDLYLNYFYSNHMNIDDGYFLITLVPISHRLNQNLLKVFSKTCRANFGDNLCGIQIEQYKQIYEVESIRGNLITLKTCNKASQYFDGGNLSFQDSLKRFRIEKHNENFIKIYCDAPHEFTAHNYVTLYPVCNKEFISCCNIFNNAVNFRGEPFAPTCLNLLK